MLKILKSKIAKQRGTYSARLLGEKCPQCGKRNMQSGYWNRAYNQLCRQATGAKGKRCYNCGFIKWDIPDFKKWLAGKPDWIVPYLKAKI